MEIKFRREGNEGGILFECVELDDLRERWGYFAVSIREECLKKEGASAPAARMV